MRSISDSVRIYPMFIEPTITWVPSGFSGYIWLDTKIVFRKTVCVSIFRMYIILLNHI